MVDKARENPCEGCEKYCVTCVKKKKYERKKPYPLPKQDGKLAHYYTYLRWVRRHKSAIRHYAARRYDPADKDAEEDWLFNHPKTAYQLINSDQQANDVKVSKIIYKIVNPENYYMASLIIGKPNSGKTWLSLLLAENSRKYNPDRNYIYFSYTKGLKLPDWMDQVHDIDDIPLNSFVIFDEAGLLANARRGMRKSNVNLGQLINVRRHKDLQFVFIGQEPKDVDPAIRRQMDFFFLKPYSFMGTDKKTRGLMETLRNFTPTGTNPHKLGFYDSNEDIGWQCWQPEPMCPEKEDFSKTYRDESISHQRQISTDESEEKNDKTYATFYCRKCGYQWTSSKITVEEHVEEGKSPRKCPECNRRTWNKEPEKDKPKAKA